MLNKLKLSTKLYLGFGTLLLLMIVLIVISLMSLNASDKTMNSLVYDNEVRMNLLFDMSDRIHVVGRAVRDLVLLNDNGSKQDAMRTLQSAREQYGKSLATLKKMPASQTEAELLSKMEQDLTTARDANNKVIGLTNSNKHQEAAVSVTQEAAPAVQKLQDDIQGIIKYQVENNKADTFAYQNLSKLIKVVTFTFAGITFLLGSLIAFLLTRNITKRINRVSGSLSDGANQIASASQQLAATSQELAASNAEQASSIEETSSTLEESASMIRQNSDNTRQATLLAGETKASADKANVEMQEMSGSMTEIKKSSDQIAKIIKVIDEIAFQTNILALNAAVEAARAGDAGMGFAVVAEEVRNLAQRSAQAAKDTAAIIETNIELSDKGVSVTRRVSESLSEITIQAKKVTELMDEISAASQEQSQGISQINKAISQMEKVTQQNAANAEESASASQELSSQAESLQDIVGELMELINGQGYWNHPSEKRRPTMSRPRVAALNPPAYKNPAVRHENSRIAGPLNKTRVVNPEEVIPLEEDNEDF